MTKKVDKMLPICIVDFNGYTLLGHFPVSFWADWDGHKVIFGGDWEGIPNMLIQIEPSEEMVYAYVNNHGGAI